MASTAPNLLERAGKFLLDDLWSVGGVRVSAVREGLLRFLRVAVLTYEGFRDDLCMLRASALTYASLMAFVPVLALSFAILRGLGWHGERLEELILNRVTLLSPEAIATVVSYIDNTSIAGLGLVGAAVLLGTFVSVMSNIESSFNAIWGCAAERHWLRRSTNYLAVMVAGPVLLALTTSMSAAVRSNAVVQWMQATWGVSQAVELSLALAALALVWLLFAFLYAFVPNTQVRLIPALIGGVVAGTTWQLVQGAYINFQVGVRNYNAIYGAMAQLPLLMVWIYVSWVIVLLGAEIVVAVQNLGVFSHERRSRAGGFAQRELVGLSILAQLAEASLERTPPPTVDDLSQILDVPTRTVRGLLDDLDEGGLVHMGGEDKRYCFLSLAPSSVPLVRVLTVLRADSDTVAEADCRGVGPLRVLADLHGSRRQVLGDATIVDLVE